METKLTLNEEESIVEEATARLGQIRIKHVRRFDTPVATKSVKQKTTKASKASLMSKIASWFGISKPLVSLPVELKLTPTEAKHRSRGIPYATIVTLIRDGKAYAAASFCHKNDSFNKAKGIQIAIARLEKLVNDNHTSPLAREIAIENIRNLDVRTINKIVSDKSGNKISTCQKEIVEA